MIAYGRIMNRQVIHNQAGTKLPMHRHDEARVIVVLDGEVCETDLYGKRRFKKGEFLFRPPFCAHANISEPASASYLRLQVSRAVWMRYISKHGWLTARGHIDLDRRDHRSKLQSRKGGDLLLEMLKERSSSIEKLPFELVWEDLAIADSREPATFCSPMRRIAENLNIKPYELTRLFARRFGVTPTAYRREIRLRRALKLLVGRDAKLARIAADCGYADQSHFSREIKSATGRSPLALRDFIFA